MVKLSIAPDFKNLLPEHNADELRQLKENVLADPKHTKMPPIIVWPVNSKQTIIIDGHHQYEIRTKNNLRVKQQVMQFASRDEAMRYALSIQFGRRNLNAA